MLLGSHSTTNWNLFLTKTATSNTPPHNQVVRLYRQMCFLDVTHFQEFDQNLKEHIIDEFVIWMTMMMMMLMFQWLIGVFQFVMYHIPIILQSQVTSRN